MRSATASAAVESASRARCESPVVLRAGDRTARATTKWESGKAGSSGSLPVVRGAKLSSRARPRTQVLRETGQSARGHQSSRRRSRCEAKNPAALPSPQVGPLGGVHNNTQSPQAGAFSFLAGRGGQLLLKGRRVLHPPAAVSL